MLAAGRKRHKDIKFQQGDALNLPFTENTFDVTTISFGLQSLLSNMVSQDMTT
jgi:demethylmenaquinone methyltransferase/2-methoxy-6-polyprenyl-1,4-benzoquinol methylase